MQIQLYNSYSKITGAIEPALFKALRDSLSYMDGERLVHLYVSRQPGLGWCFPTGLIAQVIEVINTHGGERCVVNELWRGNKTRPRLLDGFVLTGKVVEHASD